MPSKTEMADNQAWDKKVRGYGFALMRWTEYTSDYYGDDLMIKEVRVKTPMMTGGEYLVIIKATSGKDKLIAFHSAETFEDALAGAVGKLEKAGIQWKEDKPYMERNGGS